MNYTKLSILTVFAFTQMMTANPTSASAEVLPQTPVEINQDSIWVSEQEPVVEPADPALDEAISLSHSQLILTMNSNLMIQDGITYLSGQPMLIHNGVSYVAIRSLVDRVGYKLTYDFKTKETIIISGTNELRFKTDSSSYTVNGVRQAMKGASYQKDNIFMVPLTSIMQALNIPYTFNNVTKQVVMNLSMKPTASFTVLPTEIHAGQTIVTYIASASSPRGLPIIEERWEGKQEIFQEAGLHVVTYSVRDSSGEWSDPYSLTLNVEIPNMPPVALFTTNKDEYKMGELITVTDLSTDDDVDFTVQWDNKELAYFSPGIVTIGLTVTDRLGLSSRYEKSIRITDETLYSQSEFNLLFMPLGDKFTFDGWSVLSMNKLIAGISDQPSTLIRSNSPETVNQEGIVYQETTNGPTRFMIHHVNNLSMNMKMYVLATNFNQAPVSLYTQNLGFGGPSDMATATGWKSVERYFQSMKLGNKKSTTIIQPGESQLVLTELNEKKMKPGDVISLFADTYSDLPLQYTIVIIDELSDPFLKLPMLTKLDWDGVHNRGTYTNSNRTIEYSDLVGEEAARLPLGDNINDMNLVGIDPMYGTQVLNNGNFGVLYKIKFNKVAPRTLITFNPRGGKYSGVALVNGNLVNIANHGAINNPNEQSVLYRTGSTVQSVEILLTVAPGSNLPVNLIFTPLPPLK